MRFDVIVVGGGQAGVPLATRLAAAGKKVLLAERAELGGTCVNTGCTPTKTMIASARAAHVARNAGRLGVRVQDVGVDLGAVVDRKNEIVRQSREGLAKRVQVEGLTVVRGQARFAGERKVEVGGQAHDADVVVLNVGGRAAIPPIEGLAGVPWLDNSTAMQLREPPAHLIVLGGGYIGCEFGQMFRRFGSAVTIADQAEHLLSREDPEISSALEEVFRNEGIALQLGTKTTQVSGRAGEIRVRLGNGEEIRGSHLLVAVGRRPNTDDLACDKASVALDEKGWIIADDEYRTSAKGVYAVGDVLGGPQFTHTSWDDHRILYDILLDRPHRRRSDRLIPYTAFRPAGGGSRLDGEGSPQARRAVRERHHAVRWHRPRPGSGRDRRRPQGPHRPGDRADPGRGHRRRRGGRADPRLRRLDASGGVRARHRRRGGGASDLRGGSPVRGDEDRPILAPLTREVGENGRDESAVRESNRRWIRRSISSPGTEPWFWWA